MKVNQLFDEKVQRKISNKIARYFGNEIDVDVDFGSIVDGFFVILKDNYDLERRKTDERMVGNWRFETVKERVASFVFQFGETCDPEDYDDVDDFIYSLPEILDLDVAYDNIRR